MGTPRAEGVPIAGERLCFWDGAHAWIFFAEPVHAAEFHGAELSRFVPPQIRRGFANQA